MTTTPDLGTIRPAVRDDVPAILALVRELAAYEREPDAVKATEDDFVREGFGDRPAFHVLLAEEDSQPVGFALYFFGFSTWRGSKVLYLEDLFVKPSYRKRRLGLGLMRALAREAVAHGCQRFVWQVLDWNLPATRFYEALGAKVVPEWLSVRLTGEPLERLAREATDPAG